MERERPKPDREMKPWNTKTSAYRKKRLMVPQLPHTTKRYESDKKKFVKDGGAEN